jgi:hypothetical protein
MIVVMRRLSWRRGPGPVLAGDGSLYRPDRTQGARLTAEVHVKTLMMVTAAAMHEHDHARHYLLNQFGKWVNLLTERDGRQRSPHVLSRG